MPSYKLIYFDARGRAEVSRLLFALSGTSYEDVRLSSTEWAEKKKTYQFKALPALEIDGKAYAQSNAIAAYLAREFGYYGKNNIEALQIEQAVGFVNDFLSVLIKAMFEKDESKKQELMKNFQEVEVPKFLGIFEQLLTSNGTGYFAGSSLSLADVLVYELIFSLKKRMPGLAEVSDNFQVLSDLIKKVANEPKIKAYVATRKDTEN